MDNLALSVRVAAASPRKSAREMPSSVGLGNDVATFGGVETDGGEGVIKQRANLTMAVKKMPPSDRPTTAAAAAPLAR